MGPTVNGGAVATSHLVHVFCFAVNQSSSREIYVELVADDLHTRSCLVSSKSSRGFLNETSILPGCIDDRWTSPMSVHNWFR